MARFLRLPEVEDRSGLARSTIYLRISQGRFPKPVPLGSDYVVGWLESEVEEWIANTLRAARPQLAPTAA
jgi:prophage regulatory protein